MDIKQMHAAVRGFEEELEARVPEHIFRDTVIPILAGENAASAVQVWEHLAGSVFNKIQVTDPAGMTLFTVPALATSPKTSASERDSKNSLYEVMQGYEMRALVSPVFALRFMEQSLADKINTDARDYEQILYIDELLVRYGKQPRLNPELTKHIRIILDRKRAAAEGREYVAATDSAASGSVDDDDIGNDL